jgi:hypothetical protein
VGVVGSLGIGVEWTYYCPENPRQNMKNIRPED